MIPGMCRIWAKRINGEDRSYWIAMPYAARGYDDCQSIVDYYEEEWPGAYLYEITADSDLCCPVG